jgi:hypothetical protein
MFDVAFYAWTNSHKLTRIKPDYKMFDKVFSRECPTFTPTLLHLMLIGVVTYLFFYILLSISRFFLSYL